MTRRAFGTFACVVIVLVASVWPAPARAEPSPDLPTASGPAGVEVNSPSAILIDALSGAVVFEKNADDRNAPASLTKIMTLLLAVEAIEAGKLSLRELLVGTEHAQSHGGTQIWLEAGEEMEIDHILLSIAVASANDASVALAEHLAGTEEEFVELMNVRAHQLGMTGTNFANSHGLDDPEHYTTARDMALLSREAVRHPLLLQYTGIFETHIRDGKTWLVNRNQMVNLYQGCDGLKTGWTQEAKYSVSITAQRGVTRFIAVIMGAESTNHRFSDTTRMLNFGFAKYSSLLVAEKGQSYGTVPVNLGIQVDVQAVSPGTDGVLVGKGTEGEVAREVVIVPAVQAPVRRGDPLGAIVIRQGDEELGRCPLVADRDIGRISYFGLVWRLFTRVLGRG